MSLKCVTPDPECRKKPEQLKSPAHHEKERKEEKRKKENKQHIQKPTSIHNTKHTNNLSRLHAQTKTTACTQCKDKNTPQLEHQTIADDEVFCAAVHCQKKDCGLL